jgi:hypothetical protein
MQQIKDDRGKIKYYNQSKKLMDFEHIQLIKHLKLFF